MRILEKGVFTMDLYQSHVVAIPKEDHKKADEILHKYWMRGDIDLVTYTEKKNRDGVVATVFRISPYIYEDFEAIVNEFKQEGIRVM
jgi:hypothetical protein